MNLHLLRYKKCDIKIVEKEMKQEEPFLTTSKCAKSLFKTIVFNELEESSLCIETSLYIDIEHFHFCLC